MTAIKYFDDAKFYHTSDPLLEQFARPQTWRLWRAKKKGPSYLKVGGRVFYTGAELNKWLAISMVELAAD